MHSTLQRVRSAGPRRVVRTVWRQTRRAAFALAAKLRVAAPLGIGRTLKSGAPIGYFSEDDLETLDSLNELFGRLRSSDTGDCRVRHAATIEATAVPTGLEAGRNLFGPGCSARQDLLAGNRLEMKSISTILLRDALVAPRSMTVQSVSRGFLENSTINVRHIEGDPAGIAIRESRLYRHAADGRIRYRANPIVVRRQKLIAVPVCGYGHPNYGHFLYDGLPALLHYLPRLRGHRFRVVGPPLNGWQREILQALRCLDHYMELTEATLFDKVLVSDMLSLHLSRPTRFARTTFDTLRFALGTPKRPPFRTIFLSRAGQLRPLLNRDEVEAALRAEGVEIIRPETMSIAAQVTLAAESRLMIGESGAGMANVGFCDPGTAVLEIQPENFYDGYIRATCFLCALDWNVYLAHSRVPPGAMPVPGRNPHEVDVPSLVQAVRTIKSRLR